ncbi:MAG: hypothetical protein AVDCRST_MAG86-2208 [uncultured Truepera sp.]|uniref:Uncharacterized protein n=1 Tax=uncultured Truepera sp. TaxID=543023 RepID=A0A6J4VF02_9DEIN|nr:MAG: hypothetical protein AVDCRST_MAG86-2208 [uncultured Truepera sp.]
MQPITHFNGPALTFDFPGLEIGCAETMRGRQVARSSTFRSR